MGEKDACCFHAQPAGNAKAAVGDKQVTVVGGAKTAQQCLRAGLVDEIHMGIVPVLLREGLRFFEPGANEQLELERTRVFASPTRTDLWFRVQSS